MCLFSRDCHARRDLRARRHRSRAVRRVSCRNQGRLGWRRPSATFKLRVHNIMKHVCVAVRIGDGKAPGAGNSHSIAKTSNAASRGGQSRLQAYCAWMRPRSATFSAPNPRDARTPMRSHPRKRGASEGGRGIPLLSDPVYVHWDRLTSARDRLHGRIP
jgi:hypothetical protein